MANSKYTDNEVIRLVNHTDEPTFILRAKDNLSIPAIKRYHDVLVLAGDSRQAEIIKEVISSFEYWRECNPEKIQHPTL